IRGAHRGDLPKMEALFNRFEWTIKDSIRQVFEKTPYERPFVEMMNEAEENMAKCLVLENPKGRVTGYALLTSRRKPQSWTSWFGQSTEIRHTICWKRYYRKLRERFAPTSHRKT
ncbi:hypothetical protein AKJ46_00160, partial [candidate division MSBL1 archaeon SCGC-AAA833K04]